METQERKMYPLKLKDEEARLIREAAKSKGMKFGQYIISVVLKEVRQ